MKKCFIMFALMISLAGCATDGENIQYNESKAKDYSTLKPCEFNKYIMCDEQNVPANGIYKYRRGYRVYFSGEIYS